MTKTTIKLTTLNNKSRKGVYVYIKKQKAHARYYKYKGTPGEFQAYKKQFTTKKRQTAKKYLTRIRKRPTIQKTIKKGITTTTIQNATNANNTTINNAKKRLLQKLILDKKLLNIITKDENFNKIKDRLEYRITAKDQNNKTSLTTNTFNKTIQEVINQTKKDLLNKKPEYINLKGNWTGTRTWEGGTIKKINIQIIFRKAK